MAAKKSVKSIRTKQSRKLKQPKKVTVKKVKGFKKVRKNLFLGYCPECFCMVAMNDRESIQIFVCGRCKHRGRVTTLLDSMTDETDKTDETDETDKEVYTECTTKDLEVPVISVSSIKVKSEVLDDANDHEGLISRLED